VQNVQRCSISLTYPSRINLEQTNHFTVKSVYSVFHSFDSLIVCRCNCCFQTICNSICWQLKGGVVKKRLRTTVLQFHHNGDPTFTAELHAGLIYRPEHGPNPKSQTTPTETRNHSLYPTRARHLFLNADLGRKPNLPGESRYMCDCGVMVT